MSKIKFVPTLLLPALIIVLVTGMLSGVIARAQAQDENLYEVMFSIPTGKNGVHYEGVDIPEMLTWGPAALTVANDGSFWIADTADNRLLRYSPKGEFLGKIDLKGLVVGATDLVVNNDDILVLDQASLPPKVVRLTMEGVLLGSYELPDGLHLEDGLTGIARGDSSELLIEREFGSHVTQFLNEKGDLIEETETNGYLHNGKLYSVHPSGLTSATPKHGTIFVGERKIEIDVAHDLGGMQILGFGLNEDFYIILEELALNPALQVDQTIRHYDAEGILLGIARMPVDEQYTYVAQDFALGPDGNLYAVATRPDGVDILRLNFFQKLDPILTNSPLMTNVYNPQGENYGIETCVTRDTMISTAVSYWTNSKYLNSTNINGTCSGRGKPRYLSGAGAYSSVSYDWGGFDTVSGFNGYMDPNTYQAGDIDTAASESCSRGVDCSGYVSRAWQLPYKYSTCTLVDISTQLSSTSQLLRGDIMNICGVHTVIFASFNGSNGIYDYEATTYNSYDRVVYITSTWTRLSSYLPRRYNNVCP